MKTNSLKFKRAGFTLGEAMVAIGISALVAAGAAYILINGTILYAKNTAENVAHDENRKAVNRLVHDIHAAVSMPQLGKIVAGNLAANPTAPAGSWTPHGTNLTFWAVSGAGPAEGVSFKKMGNAIGGDGGPFEVRNDPGNKDLIQIDSGSDNAPAVGMEIVFPYYGMEGTITKVTSNGSNHWNIWAAGALETRIKKKNATSVVCYYMSRFAYVVVNGELRFYSASPPPTGVTWPIVVARNIINEADRTLPAKPFSQTNTDYVGINLTTEDTRYSNRKYKAVNTLLAGSVPIRAKIAKSQ